MSQVSECGGELVTPLSECVLLSILLCCCRMSFDLLSDLPPFGTYFPFYSSRGAGVQGVS
jgi:hypothetical protein